MSRVGKYAVFGALVVALGLSANPAVAAEHRLGAGLMYWTSVSDLAKDGFDVEEDGVSAVLSYHLLPAGIFSFEFDLEYYPDGTGGSNESAFSPVAFLLVGHGLYGGVGVGVTFSDGFEDEVSDPFWAARVGWDFQLLPKIHFDVNLNYRANTFSSLDEADSDSITLGGFVRVKL